MAKNQISLEKFKALLKSLKKIRNKLDTQSKAIVKTINAMNKNVYHGGNAANEWYYTADVSCTSNKNFLEKLDLNIAKLEKQYKKMYDAAHAQAAQASQTAIAGTTPSGNAVVAAAGNMSEQEKQMLYALVYAEASENPNYVTSDSMGVASVVYNRLSSGNYGNSISSVITSPGQFAGYNNAKYNAYMSNPSVMSPEMKAAIDAVAAGQRSTSAQFFNGNGTYNTFH